MDSVHVADIDGDGDGDILANSDLGVAWYANSRSDGTFGGGQMISELAPRTAVLAAADLDGDGDQDIHAVIDDHVVWFENTDGAGTFNESHVILIMDFASSVEVADIDGDGDLDVLASSSYCCLIGGEHKISWHESRLMGDSNNDGKFDSGDLVQAFVAGKYESKINATFDEGDWNQDGDFDSGDLVLAFQSGHYITGAGPLAAEIAAAVDEVFRQGRDTGRAFVA